MNKNEGINYILWDIVKANDDTIRKLKIGFAVSAVIALVYISGQNKKIDQLRKEVKELKALREE